MPIKKADYPNNWRCDIRPRILHRAGHCCERCGVENYTVGYRNAVGDMQALIVGESYSEANALRHRMVASMGRKLIVVRLQISHLNQDEWNHEVEDKDLAALCEKCHFNHDKVDNQFRKSYGRHYKRYQLAMNI